MLGQTTLGIDISNERISLALLSQTNKGIELLKSVSAPMPEGVMSEGNIKNPQLLAKTVKELSWKNKISTRRVVVSLAAKPAILRVMELPKDMPGNPAQYVRDELKHYAVMSGKTIMQDICALAPQKKTRAARLLCGAADEEKITELVKAFNRAGVNIKAVEPGILACVRLLYANKIAKKFNSKVLVMSAQDTTMTFSVFDNANLDFIHTFEMSAPNISDDQNIKDLLSEIHSIRQFYDVEMENTPKAWDIIIAVSGQTQNCGRLQQILQNGLVDANVHITSSSTLSQDAQLIASEQAQAVSPISAGLAMKYFKTGLTGLEINLLPAGADEIHNMEKFGLMTAAVAIIALILSFAAVPLLQIKLNDINKAVTEYKQKQFDENIAKIIAEITSLNEKNKALVEKTQVLKTITDSPDSVRNWAKILADISSRTPKNLRITNLTTKDNTTLHLVGQASSYDNINRFVRMLSNSPYVSSATLVKSEIDPSTQNLRLYNITCTFSARGATNAD